MTTTVRARDLGIRLGSFPAGQYNAITDVPGVRVGHVTLIDEGQTDPPRGPARTGVTVVVPHADNVFRDKVAAAFHVVNGFGKATGSTQVHELGTLETPIALTNTLSVGAAFEGLVRHALHANPEIGRTTGTVNPVVAECSDARLNDIRALRVRPEHVISAIEAARSGPVEEGSVGAGTGMTCYGWKGGIGTASRVVEGPARTSYTVGALVLANFGNARDLRIGDIPVGKFLRPPQEDPPAENAGGSCVIVVATSAPADARQLSRLARRAQNGLARTGTFGEHGSGEYVIAFSPSMRTAHIPNASTDLPPVLPEDGPLINLLFQAVTESTEEAVVNALVTARTVGSPAGAVVQPLPLERLTDLLARTAPH